MTKRSHPGPEDWETGDDAKLFRAYGLPTTDRVSHPCRCSPWSRVVSLVNGAPRLDAPENLRSQWSRLKDPVLAFLCSVNVDTSQRSEDGTRFGAGTGGAKPRGSSRSVPWQWGIPNSCELPFHVAKKKLWPRSYPRRCTAWGPRHRPPGGGLAPKRFCIQGKRLLRAMDTSFVSYIDGAIPPNEVVRPAAWRPATPAVRPHGGPEARQHHPVVGWRLQSQPPGARNGPPRPHACGPHRRRPCPDPRGYLPRTTHSGP